MGPAVHIYDSGNFPAHFMILLKTIRNQYSLKILIEFQRMLVNGKRQTMRLDIFRILWQT